MNRFFCYFFYIFLFVCISFFILFKNKTFAFDIIQNENVTVSATVSGSTIIIEPGGSSGGIGQSIVLPKTAVRFSGYAYPFASVYITKGGKEMLVVIADKNGYFDATLEEKYDKTVLYSILAKDLLKNKSLMLNYPLAVTEGFITHVSGILFAPTVFLNKKEVLFGDYLNVSGYAVPEREIEVVVNGFMDKKFFLTSKKDGTYFLNLPTFGMPKGEYVLALKYKDDTRLSRIFKFFISDKNIFNKKGVEVIPGDCNTDNIINLVDFSVLAFWYKKPNPPICVDVNKDGIVNLIDFSILAYYWTS